MTNASDLNNRNTSLKLIANRLGDRESLLKSKSSSLDGIESMSSRLATNGGFFQQDRMIFDKQRSLDRALLYSYQAFDVKKITNVTEDDENVKYRALINPDKLKVDYDDKIFSTRKENGFKEGDVFEWLGTNTYWIIYLQDYNEVAYFRSSIRRCQYEITWETEEGTQSTYAAITGPVETKINYIQKHLISVDTPNYSIHILMPRTKETLEYFRRYAKFYLQDQDEGSEKICWRVEAIDWISTPGILEINAVEYYANEIEDDVEAGQVGIKKTKIADTNDSEINNLIYGESIIKTNQVYIYTYNGINNGTWSIDNEKTKPIQFSINPKNPLQIKLIWNAGYGGSFNLCFGKYKKEIQVTSLFQK